MCLGAFRRLIQPDPLEHIRRARDFAPVRRLAARSDDAIDLVNFELVSPLAIRPGDLILCRADDVLPNDGEIVAGAGSTDYTLLRNWRDSRPDSVRREGEVLAGERLLTGWLVIRVTRSFGDCMIDTLHA